MNESNRIIALLQKRDETALQEVSSVYGNRCYRIALQMLGNAEDAEECVNDMLLDVWNSVPPHCPKNLEAYLVALLRRTATDKLRKTFSVKRGGGERHAALDELEECIPAKDNPEEMLDAKMLQSAIEHFLDELSSDARTIFVERYTRLTPISEIAEKFRVSESKVKITLMRVRKKLKTYLKKEGWL